MLIDPKIIRIEPKIMVGLSITTNQKSPEHTQQLWRSFMPHISKISHKKDQNLYSIQLYPSHIDFSLFNPDTTFQKWAAVEVEAVDVVPEGMKTLQITSGDYAIFIHHGPAINFPKTAQYIFGMWLPNSIYDFDARPQFEIMGPNYKGPEDADSQEEVWIPIKKKATY